MSTLTASLKLDVLLQAKSKLYHVGIGVAVLLGLMCRALIGPEYAAKAVPLVYLFGLGSTAYVFVAAMVLFEKDEGTLLALRTTPLTVNTYIASKIVTLVTFAMVEGLIIQLVGFWGVDFNPVVLFFGALLTGLMYLFLGLGQVASKESIFSFLIPTAIVTGAVLPLPFLYVFDIGAPWMWYLFPTQGPLLIMLGAFKTLETWQWIYAVIMSLVSVGALAWWTRRQFNHYIRLQEA